MYTYGICILINIANYDLVHWFYALYAFVQLMKYVFRGNTANYDWAKHYVIFWMDVYETYCVILEVYEIYGVGHF
jgi:hypothetical protein